MKRLTPARVLSLLVCIAVCFVPAIIGSQARPGPWYDGLTKPALTPPGVVFPIAWTTLYLLMAVAAWLVWCRRDDGRARTTALVAFGVQLVLNAAWSPVFFGMQRPGAALVVLVCLWVAIVVTLVLFRRVRPLAAWLLVPYLAWVSFAGYLNGALWWLNR